MRALAAIHMQKRPAEGMRGEVSSGQWYHSSVLRWQAMLSCVLALTATTAVRAHEKVDEARVLYEEARFADALTVLGEAEAGDDLAREDLTELYVLRAGVHLAMRNDDAVRSDLARLHLVDPTFEFGRRASPDLVRAHREVQAESVGDLRLVADPSAVRGGVSVAASMEGDPLGMVRHVRIFARADDEWQSTEESPLVVLTQGQSAEYYVQAVGPGGVVLAEVGSRAAPLRFDLTGTPLDEAPPPARSKRALVWGLVGAAVALVAGGVVLAVVLSNGGSDQTRVQPFTVEF